MAAKCRSCKAEIRWVRMPSGKAMPVDPKAKTMVVLDETGVRTTGHTVQAYESHFATCPNAEDHRAA